MPSGFCLINKENVMKIMLTILLLSILTLKSEINEPDFIWETRTAISELQNINSKSLENKKIFIDTDSVFITYSYSNNNKDSLLNSIGMVIFNLNGNYINNYEYTDSERKSSIFEIFLKDDFYRFYLREGIRYNYRSYIYIKEFEKDFSLLNDLTKKTEFPYSATSVLAGYDMPFIDNKLYYTCDTNYLDENNQNLHIVYDKMFILDTAYNRTSVNLDTANVKYTYDKRFSPNRLFKYDEQHLLYSLIGPKIDSENKYQIICVTDLNANIEKQMKIELNDYSLLSVDYLGKDNSTLFFNSTVKSLDSEEYLECQISLDENLNMIGYEIIPDSGFTAVGRIMLKDRKQILEYGVIYDDIFAPDYGWWYAYRLYDYAGNILGTYRWYYENERNDKIFHARYLGNDEIVIVGDEFDEVYLAKIKLPEITSVELKTIEDKISIYPNPVNDYLNISLDNNYFDSNANIKILDIFGNEALSKVAKSNDISVNVNKLSAGSYFVKIIGNNEHIYTLKFIKQ